MTSTGRRSFRIKLCGVRDVRDALLCAAAGADELGIVFAPKSRRRVSLAEARAIRESLPAALPLIGVFQDATLAELEEAARAASLRAVQLHGALPRELFTQRSPLPFAIHRALQLESGASAAPADLLASLPARSSSWDFDRLLLDGPRGGSGAPFPWSLSREIRERYQGPLFVAGGLHADNVAEAIAAAEPDGVDVSSGIEGPDGFKDEARVRRFVEAARAAAQALLSSRGDT